MKQNRLVRCGPSFTLIELLVVITIVSLIASLLLPALAGAKAKAQELRCASNHRQLGLVWLLYSEDSDDRLARNGYVTRDGEKLRPLWVQGYYNHVSSPRDSTNHALMIDPKYSLFAPYLKKGDIAVYHCPSDRGGVTIGGKLYPRLRSYAMNWSLGYDGVGGGNGKPEFVFLKSTAIARPSGTILTTGVASNSICWPFFGIFQTSLFQMLPGRYHRNGAVMSFADGHVEYKRWKDPRTFRPPPDEPWHIHKYLSANNADLRWLQSRAGKP